LADAPETTASQTCPNVVRVRHSRAECSPPLKSSPLALVGMILLNVFEILNQRSLDFRGMPLASSHSTDVRAVNSQTVCDSAVDATKRVNETTYSLESGGVLTIAHLLHSCRWTP
jgi:hypothetical protein